MIRVLFSAFCFIAFILSISGCANRVAPSVQQRYLVVSATMVGNVDITNIRYFVFLKYNASSTAGPDLLVPNQYNYVLSASGAATTGIDGITTGAGNGAVTSNFNFDEFYERSTNKGVSFGTFANQNSTGNPAVIVTVNTTTIQFSIPLNTASSPIGINIVTTNDANYLIQDHLASGTSDSGYHLFANTVGNTYSNPVISTPSIASSADIISWSASII